MSLFCHAASPIAGATTGVHDGENKNVIRMNLKDDGVTELPDQTSPGNLSVDGESERMRSYILERLVHHAGKGTTVALVLGMVTRVGID